MNDGSRCTGHCCRRFPLTATIPELKEDLARGVRGEHRKWRADQSAFVLDMLIPLPEPGPSGQYYTCRHLTASGDCGAYERRPDLCRDYPFYGRNGRCTNHDCTWEDGRNPPVPASSLTKMILQSKILELKNAISKPEETKA